MHSYFQAQYSELTSEYQIESGVLRRAACKAVQMTLSITPPRFKITDTVTGFPNLSPRVTYAQPPKSATAFPQDPGLGKLWRLRGGQLGTMKRQAPFSVKGLESPPGGTVCPHRLPGAAAYCTSCPLDCTEMGLLGA